MLRSVKDLEGYKIKAKDSEIGSVQDFYFNGKDWVVRYMIVDTGGWLPGRKVLIATDALRQPEWELEKFPVDLTKEQIENSPDIDTDKPISLQQEEELRKYYNWPPLYKMGGGLFDEERVGLRPDSMAETIEAQETRETQQVTKAKEEESVLRSVDAVTGYYIHARDGDIGHVDDFIVDDEDWAICYIVVDTRNWLPGRKVLVSPSWIEKISWRESKVHVDLSRETVKNSPEYDPDTPISEDYETRLKNHYNRNGK